MTLNDPRAEVLLDIEHSMDGWLETFIDTVLEDQNARGVVAHYGELKVKTRLYLAMKNIAHTKLQDLLPKLREQALNDTKLWKLSSSSTSEDDS